MAGYLFANGRSGFPFSFDGGAERTTFTLLSKLAERGISVIQVCLLPEDGVADSIERAASMGMTCLKNNGEPVFLVDGTALKIRNEHVVLKKDRLTIIAVKRQEFYDVCYEISTRNKPKLIVTWLNGSKEILRMADALGISTVLRVVGPTPEGFPPLAARTTVLANSPVTAQMSSRYYGRKVGFLPGTIDYAAYGMERPEPRFVTYVNPRKEKGVHLFCKIAALLPNIPFLVVRGWSRTPLEPEEAMAIDFLDSLPNITIIDAVPDMRPIYARTRVLLLPSRWQEAWSRTIGEAQFCGIPVIASDRGSSAQCVGKGGVVLDYADPMLWANIVRMVFRDDSLRNRLGKWAKLNTKRFALDVLSERYMKFFASCVEGSPEIPGLAGKAKILRARRDSPGGSAIYEDEITMDAAADLSDPVLD